MQIREAREKSEVRAQSIHLEHQQIQSHSTTTLDCFNYQLYYKKSKLLQESLCWCCYVLIMNKITPNKMSHIMECIQKIINTTVGTSMLMFLVSKLW